MTHSFIVSARVHFVNISMRLRERRISILTLLFVTIISSILAVVLFGGPNPEPREGIRRLATPGVLRRMLPRLFGFGKSAARKCSRPHDLPDNGDCQALGGPRRPSWACLSSMKGSLPSFVKLYKRRPLKTMRIRMRIEASFALFYTLRKVKPAVVIQTGSSDWGYSIWLIKRALPNAQIISLDPKVPLKKRIRGVKYSTVGFGQIDWNLYIGSAEKRRKTLVLIQDADADAYSKLFKENASAGLRHFIFQDNYAYLRGKSNSLKSICEVLRKNQWRIGSRIRSKLTWNQHIEQGNHLNRALKIYYEFPPIAANSLVQHKFSETGATSTPIVTTKRSLKKYFGDIPLWEFSMYGHLAYVEIRN